MIHAAHSDWMFEHSSVHHGDIPPDTLPELPSGANHPTHTETASALKTLWHQQDLMGGTSAASSSGTTASSAKAAAPTLTVASSALTVNEGGSVALPISVTPSSGHHAASVTITGLASYETVTDALDGKTFTGNSITLTAAEVNSGLTLSSAYAGTGEPVNTLAVTASETFGHHTLTSAAQDIVVTDPLATTGSSTASTGTGTTSTTNTLTLQVSGDMYDGNPQIEVLVDGQQVGSSTYAVTADHSQGQTQTITITGNFDPTTAHQVQVEFVNDAWDGTSTADGHDRNVYVESVSLNGATLTGSQGTDAATNGVVTTSNPHEAVMDINGALAFNVPADPPATTGTSSTGTSSTGTSSTNSLTLQVSGDMYDGNPQIEVLVDGQQVGSSSYTVTADHAQGQTQTITITGNFDPTTAHQVQVEFVNDAWDGTSTADGHDRNVYVESVSLNGATLTGSQGTDAATNGVVTTSNPSEAVMDINGTLAFNVPADPPAGSSGIGSSSSGTGSGSSVTGSGTTGSGTTGSSGTSDIGTGAQNPGQTTDAFYVSPTGSDSNSGTLAAPFATLGRAQQAMEGSSIKTTYVEGGTYNLSSTLDLTAADSGETWQYYAPNGVDSAILNGGGNLNPIISIEGGASNIIIDGLTVENFGIVGIHSGAGGGALTSGITIENCNIGFGQNTSDATSGGIVFDNTVNISVLNNYIHDVPAAGIAVYAYNPGDQTSGVIANNVVLNTVQARSDSGAIYTEMLSTAANSLTIENNFVADYGSAGNYGQIGIYLDEGANHVTITGNVVGPPTEGSVPSAGTNDTAAAFTDAGFDNTFSNNIVDLGDSGRVFAVEFYGYSGYGESGNVFEGNTILSDFTGAQGTNMSGETGYAYFQNMGPASNYAIENNVYWNYAAGGSEFTNGVLASDSNPIIENPQISTATYTVASSSPLYNSPVNFAPIVGGWGPAGFIIPQTGVTASDLA